ncbi:hypothetical protein M8J77_010378 [Diaphorina citri]|nr:hypothetical protein M8J77_010378 [Diaphorina citri]
MGCASSGQPGAVHADSPGAELSNGGIMKDTMAKMSMKGDSLMGKAKDLVDSEITQPLSNMADDAMKKVHEVGEVVEDKLESLFSSADDKKQEMQNGLDTMTESVKPDTPIDDIEKNMKTEVDEMLENVEADLQDVVDEDDKEKDPDKDKDKDPDKDEVIKEYDGERPLKETTPSLEPVDERKPLDIVITEILIIPEAPEGGEEEEKEESEEEKREEIEAQ